MERHEGVAFFTKQLMGFQEEELPADIISLLEKSPVELEPEESKRYKNFLLPHREDIKKTLAKAYEGPRTDRDLWAAAFNACSATLIGMIAAEMMGENIAKPAEEIPDVKSDSVAAEAVEAGASVGEVSRSEPLVETWRRLSAPAASASSEKSSPPSPPIMSPLYVPATARETSVAGAQLKRFGHHLSTAGKKRLTIYALILVIIVGGIAVGASASSQPSSNSTQQVTAPVQETRPATTTAPVAPAKSADTFISLDNVSDSQQLNVGPSIIAGTRKAECSIVLNGIQVGVTADQKFYPTVDIVEGNNNLNFVITDTQGKTYSKSIKIIGILSPDLYKAVSPAGPDFAHLNKNPDAYAGTRCMYRGQVVQIMEGYGTTDIRMDITPMGYGYWTDTIYVELVGSTPAVEKDIITIYGTIKGSYTYSSIAGYQITLPLIDAKYVDVE